MREDIASPPAVQRVKDAEMALKEAWRARDEQAIDRAADDLSAAVHAIYPPHKQPRLRENIEILVVAISVAMAFRTFYVQPFRIPTGSMQPTLYGITYEEEPNPGLMDRLPFSIVRLALFGERYVEIKAKAEGRVEFHQEFTEDSFVFRIAGMPHVIPQGLPRLVSPGASVRKGEVLARGRKKLGDHIFVNRLWYNFFKPERGDVFVFSTRDIRHPDIRPDNYYIKRMAGMPGEEIGIEPPYLLAGGQRVTEPYPFERLVHGDGYFGYTLVGETPIPALLRRQTDRITLGPQDYLPLGDNTRASLDGRFFGGVNRKNIVGPAVVVYWPISDRWGWIR